MSKIIPAPLENLIEKLANLPGIGHKTAERLAYFLIKTNDEERHQLAKAIETVASKLKVCKNCFNWATEDYCSICSNENRDHQRICVVPTVQDLIAIEETSVYDGLYHVLNGEISPSHHQGPEQLNLQALFNRVKNANPKIKEIIIATNPNAEGELTANYITEQLKPIKGLILTRIAYGLPSGAKLEYADSFTLKRALMGRTKLNK